MHTSLGFIADIVCFVALIPCASSPCLNGGTCNNINGATSYQCTCTQSDFGQRCETGRV